ncbi:beta-lactamase family protein [bacterium]|nr:beta-lactamase family protein [bacterium]
MQNNKVHSVLDDYFHEREARELFSGVVRISTAEEVLYNRAFGFANRAWKIPNKVEYRFDTASVTKLFTAVAVLQLIDQQLFNLDTRVVEYLNLIGTAIPSDVTVFHLMTHSSGIADDCEEEDNENYEESWLTEPCYAVTETKDFLHRFIHKPPNFKPGAGCRYCNCSFVLLGLMIEKASGLQYRDYILKQVFEAIGMNDSTFFHQAYVTERLAEGYDPVLNETGEITGYKRNIFAFPPIGSPDGGAHVTARDLDHFLRTIMAGKVLSPELTAKLFQPHVYYDRTDEYELRHGFVFLFYLDSKGEVVCFKKEGYSAGVSAEIRYYPAQDICITILSNMAEGVWEPLRELHKLVCTGSLRG